MRRRGRGRAGSGVRALTLGTALGLALAVLAGAGPAAAEDDGDERLREGLWVSLAGVAALQNASDSFSDLDDSGGVHLRLGVRPASALDFGLFVEWIHYDGADPVSAGAFVKLFLFELFDVRLLDGMLQPYAFGSGGAMFVDDSRAADSTTAGGNFRGGAGVDVVLGDQVVLFGEVHYSGAGGDVTGIEGTHLLAGLAWRF